MSHDPESPEGAAKTDAPAGPDPLELAFAELKGQLRELVARLRTLSRDIAEAAAARIEADAAIADAAIVAFEPGTGKRHHRRGQVKRLEQLTKRLSLLEIDPRKGRRRDLKVVARSVRRIVAALTEPVDE
jgi:hypothetical protein